MGQLEGGFAKNEQYAHRVRKFLAAVEERQEKNDTSVRMVYRSESEISVSLLIRERLSKFLLLIRERLSKFLLLTNSVFSTDKAIRFEGESGGSGIGAYRKKEDLLRK